MEVSGQQLNFVLVNCEKLKIKEEEKRSEKGLSQLLYV